MPNQNVAIDYKFSDGKESQLPSLAADLVQRQVAILVATSRPAALAAKAATANIPIVFTSGEDPVSIGLVASLNHPGGNATGVSVFTTELGPKRLGILREFLTKPGVIAFVVDPNNGSAQPQIKVIQAAADAVAQPLLVLNAGTESEIDAAFATMAQQRVSAVLYGASTFFQVVSDRLIALAARQSIPALYEWREFVAAGGLMSYSTNVAEIGRQIGTYAGQILKGAKPADLPVVQSSRFEFVINLKTANALGLTVPPTLLARADEVIE
jgi:putative ABC transport system substrate-binding protein